jgi:hypothetical protein
MEEGDEHESESQECPSAGNRNSQRTWHGCQSRPGPELQSYIVADELEKPFAKKHAGSSESYCQNGPKTNTKTMAIIIKVNCDELAVHIELRSAFRFTRNRREQKGEILWLGWSRLPEPGVLSKERKDVSPNSLFNAMPKRGTDKQGQTKTPNFIEFYSHQVITTMGHSNAQTVDCSWLGERRC